MRRAQLILASTFLLITTTFLILATGCDPEVEPERLRGDTCYEFAGEPECEAVQLPGAEVWVCCDAAECAVWWMPPTCRDSTCCGAAACVP
jgi:hypothetical protein